MIRILLTTVLVLATTSLHADDGFEPLLNGTDLSGWKSIRAETGKGKSSFSYNQETQSIHVYAGEDAGSEQPIDCLYTEKEYSHYVLKMEYRWLEKRFEPRLTHDRDGGLLFHVHGNLGKLWPKCVEMQLGESVTEKEKDRYVTGDLWVIGKDIQVMNARDEKGFYRPGNKLVPVGKDQSYDKSYIKVRNEKPHGDWNEITLTIRGGQEAIYELNGKVVNRVTDLSHEVDGIRGPLQSGRIGLQAEYAELEYRNIRIKELPLPEVITVYSLEGLMPYLDDDNVQVKLEPGIYTLTEKEARGGKYTNPLFMFSGNNSSYDFTGVTLNVETKGHASIRPCRCAPDPNSGTT